MPWAIRRMLTELGILASGAPWTTFRSVIHRRWLLPE